VTWYAALQRLSGFTASIVQLAVPVLAAVGGVLLLGERITARLILAGALVLGGIALAIVGRRSMFEQLQ
jgi:drug/metabolite transporter (DMT)-like permease